MFLSHKMLSTLLDVCQCGNLSSSLSLRKDIHMIYIYKYIYKRATELISLVCSESSSDLTVHCCSETDALLTSAVIRKVNLSLLETLPVITHPW